MKPALGKDRDDIVKVQFAREDNPSWNVEDRNG